MHNISSVPVPVLCFGLVTSTPLPPPHRTFLPRALPSRPQKHRKGKTVGEKAAGSRAPGRPSGPPPQPPCIPTSPERRFGGGEGHGLRIFAQGPRQELRRPRRVSQSVSLSVLSYPSPMISFRDYPARVLLCSSRGGSGSGVMQPRGSGSFGFRHCWNADALRRS